MHWAVLLPGIKLIVKKLRIIRLNEAEGRVSAIGRGCS